MKIKDVLASRLKGIDAQVKRALLSKPYTVLELANKLDVSPKKIEKSIESLRFGHHNVTLAEEKVTIEKQLEQGARLSVSSKDFFNGKSYQFGFLSDTHLCSRHSRLDVLRCLYDIYGQEGITRVFHGGNIVDGECRFNRYDLVTRSGMEAQIEYLFNEYPYVKGIKTSFIVGDDHEGWWTQREGVDVGNYIAERAKKAGRDDLEYLSYLEADLDFVTERGKKGWLRVMHSGGGSAYAISYTTQKIVESLQGGEKPGILLVGHHHKYESGYPREVHVCQGGCTQDQTAFMRKKKIQAMVGGTIIQFNQGPGGEFNRFKVEWIPFYDRSFYARGEKYRRW